MSGSCSWSVGGVRIVEGGGGEGGGGVGVGVGRGGGVWGRGGGGVGMQEREGMESARAEEVVKMGRKAEMRGGGNGGNKDGGRREGMEAK